MAGNTNYPLLIDSLFNPTAATELNDPVNPHHLITNRANDAVVALETKVGVTNSADPASIDYQVTRFSSGVGAVQPNKNQYTYLDGTGKWSVPLGTTGGSGSGSNVTAIVAQDSVFANSPVGAITLTLVGDVPAPQNESFYGVRNSARGFYVPGSNTFLGGDIQAYTAFHGGLQADTAGIVSVAVPTVALGPAHVAGAGILISNAAGDPGNPSITLAYYAPSGASPHAIARAVELGADMNGLEVSTDLAGPVNLIGPNAQLTLATPAHTGAVPALAAAGSGSGQQAQVWLRGDDTWQPQPLASTAAPGIVPALAAPGSGSGQQAQVWLRGDDTWQSLPYSTLTGVPASFAPSAHQASHVTGADQIPSASASARGFLAQVSGLTTDYVRGDNTCADLATAAKPTIWLVRQRSFNAVGNPTFEVDQRNVGNTLAGVASGNLVQDRWMILKIGTMAISAGQQSFAAGVNVPGTSFAITRSFFRITLTTPEASLAAGDYLAVWHQLEGPRWRELQNDLHSIQILVRSSVAGLSFGMVLQDPSGAHSLTNRLTLPSANVWTLLTLPNLPLWAAGTFVNTPGNLGYILGITLAAGSTFASPANGIWQNGNFLGAAGQSNFAASPVNSTFDIAFVQHEPGPECSGLIDLPFTDNLRACKRYYQKSYPYGQALGTAGSSYAQGNSIVAFSAAAYTLYANMRFPVEMAKTPSCTPYNSNSPFAAWTANLLYGSGASTIPNATATVGVTSASSTQNGLLLLNMASGTSTSPATGFFEWAADTGW